MKIFFETLETSIKIFFFMLIIFLLARMSFIFFLRDYLGEVTAEEIFTAIFFGERLSCQTAGILTLIILVPIFFVRILKISDLPIKIFSAIIFSTTIILSAAAIPFYRQFHSNFNQMIFAGLNDDFFALFITFLEQFQLIQRFFLALILIFITYKIFFRLINFPSRIKHSALLMILNFLIINFSIYGGGWNWQTELNFENIGVTKNNLLNESALDCFQAINRANILQNRILSSSGLNFSAEQVKNLAANLSGKNPTSDNLDDYLKKFSGGKKIQKPKHIFLIVSESLANWAMLEKYSELHLADGLKNLASRGAYCKTFLPNGGSTISAVTGIVTGFADANLYLTTIPQSYEKIYPTAAALQMKNLGYSTNFFYAGPSTWEKISDFTTAEGDIKNIFPDATGNVWGVDDKFLYQFVEKKINSDVPTFNIILNVSNHAPYTVDLKSEGIEINFDSEISNELGHYKYADRELTNFVSRMSKKIPESLFVIVGDHADRYHVEKNPDEYERFCVPLIIFGCGVEKNILPENCAGSQIDILPTIIELIAEKNFEYYSVGRSLTENFCGVNYMLFITANFIGNANNFPLQAKNIFADKKNPAPNLNEIENYINAVRGISYWRVKNGNNLR